MSSSEPALPSLWRDLHLTVSMIRILAQSFPCLSNLRLITLG